MTRSSISAVLTLLLLLLLGCAREESDLTSVRIGWQTAWATQGQIVQVLKRTDVLARNGLSGSFVGVTYGAPLNEAALAGSVDVIFTADQPAAALLARGADWVIVGRLMFNRVGLYVPPDSPVRTIADLNGKTIAMPFGAAAQRVALKAIEEAGLEPASDIHAVNLDITEQAGIVLRGSRSSWGEIDAMAGFDPMMAVLETRGAARILEEGRVTSVIVMSRAFIMENLEAATLFVQAFKEATFYYAKHQEQANEWFREDSQLTFDDSVLALAASVEPNIQAERIDDVSVTFTEELLQGMQEAADFLYDMELVGRRVLIADYVDEQYARQADINLVSAEYDQADVKVISGDETGF